MTGCGPGCRFPHFCGDAILDDGEGELCDFGAQNGAFDSPCTTSCNIIIP
jgi:hypothetical protein